jgi:hypothetical protein
MISPLRDHSPSPAWRVAALGVLASLPATAVLNWLPNSHATVGGSAMFVGALVAGALATTRSTDPGAAGLRAGFLGGVVSILTVVVTLDPSAAWPLSRVVFGIVAGIAILSIAPVFGLLFGCLGGWVANAVASGPTTGANAS